eukprot:COSAG01_NODE_7243_length_3287_cov_2.111669_1_plen_166_part_00
MHQLACWWRRTPSRAAAAAAAHSGDRGRFLVPTAEWWCPAAIESETTPPPASAPSTPRWSRIQPAAPFTSSTFSIKPVVASLQLQCCTHWGAAISAATHSSVRDWGSTQWTPSSSAHGALAHALRATCCQVRACCDAQVTTSYCSKHNLDWTQCIRSTAAMHVVV